MHATGERAEPFHQPSWGHGLHEIERLGCFFFTTASVRCGLTLMHAWSSRAVPRKQGRKMSMAPYKICKRAREPDGIYCSRPSLEYVSKAGRIRMALHSVRVSRCLALYSDGFLFPHGRLVLYMQCRASSWQSSRCLAPVLHAATPAESKRCLDMFSVCVSERTWMLKSLTIHVIERGTSHEAKTDTKSMRGKRIREVHLLRTVFFFY